MLAVTWLRPRSFKVKQRSFKPRKTGRYRPGAPTVRIETVRGAAYCLIVKTCVTCHVDKPLSDFNLRRAAVDGHQPRCRACCAAWYAANRARHSANTSARNARERAKHALLLGRYLLDHPCVDCGEDDVRCLEFDHRPDESKRANVSDLSRLPAPWRVIEAEIAKCDVRCANCHRRRTAERGRWWRQNLQQESISLAYARAAARLDSLSSGS